MISLFFFSGAAAGFVFGILWETATVRIAHWAVQKGYHYHHSLFGPLFLLGLPLFRGSSGAMLLLTGAAAGVVLQHSLNEGFVFITREPRRLAAPAALHKRVMD